MTEKGDNVSKSNKAIYLDYQATTPLDQRVLDQMMPYLTEKFGNPHSTNHSYGWEANAGVDIARQQVADLINADEAEIVFTSGATESNNIAIKGAAYAAYPEKDHIITVQTEHNCVLQCCKSLEKSGFNVTYLPVDYDGLINLNDLDSAITDKTSLVSVMAVNNEIGVIQDLKSIGKICKKHNVMLHTDAAQAAGKIPLNVKDMNIDLLSISGHKTYGPKGVGALYVNDDAAYRPLAIFDGGGQENGLRSGTLAPALCVGVGAACQIAEQDMVKDHQHIATQAERLKLRLFSNLDNISINGSLEYRYPGNLNICIDGVKGDQFLKELRMVAVSTGSACATEKVTLSHVLTAIGLNKDQITSSVRIGIGRMTTEKEIDQAAEQIIAAVTKIRNQL